MSKLSQIHIERLLKLADHLEHGKLGHEVFDFNRFNCTEGPEGETYGPFGCGTRGCAIGECPIAFPKDWFFDNMGSPVCFPYKTSEYSARNFFGVTGKEFQHLFMPYDDDVEDGGVLKCDATKEQVAEHIRNFALDNL